MKKMCCLLALVLTGTAWASIETDDNVNEVYYRGSAEPAGTTSYIFRSDEFPDASPENPVFIRFAPDHGSVLADTRVDLNSLDPAINTPILLRLVLDTDEAGYYLAAQPTAVAIVRWVAGESGIWLRITDATSHWVGLGDGVQAPTPAAEVSFTLGLFDTYSDATPAFLVNLSEHAAREGGEGAAATVVCLDLTASTLTADGLVDSLLNYDIGAYPASAETAPGVYVAENRLPINFTGSFSIARGMDYGHDFSATSEPAPITAPLTQAAYFAASVPVMLRLHATANSIVTRLNDARLTLTVPEGAGWGITGVTITNENLDVAPMLTQPVGDSGGFARVELILNPSTYASRINRLDNYGLGLNLALSVPVGLPAQTLTVTAQPTLLRDVRCGAVDIVLDALQVAVAQVTAGRIFPHLTQPGNGFQSTLTATNTGTEAAEYGLQFFNASGEVVGSISAVVAAGLTVAADLSGFPDAAWVRTDADDTVVVALAYQAERADSAPAHVAQATVTARRWRLTQGNDQTFDAMAFVSLGAGPADVTVHQIGADGSALDDLDVAAGLAPGHKATSVLNAHFAPVAGSSYIIEATEPIAVIALRGDDLSRFMWQNPATPLD